MGVERETSGVRRPHELLRAMLVELGKNANMTTLSRAIEKAVGAYARQAYVRWTHAECPVPSAERVIVRICSEVGSVASERKNVFAVCTDRDVDTSPSLQRWRAEAQGVVRRVDERDAVIVDEPDVIALLAGPRVVLLGSDITQLVVSAAAFEQREQVRERALAKLTREEREALGVQ